MESSLGISFGYHDSAIALLDEFGNLSAEQEERFSRVKFDAGFPEEALDWLANQQKLRNVNRVFFYEDPNLKRKRILRQFFRNPFLKPTLAAEVMRRLVLTSQDNFSEFILKSFNERCPGKLIKIDFIEHHLSHAASTFFTSSFEESSILVVDGVGEKTSTSIWFGNKNEILPVESIDFPNSLGLFYAAFSSYCGFKVNSGEYKFMGLAPYGRPIFKNAISERYLRTTNDGFYQIAHKRLGISKFDGFSFRDLESFFGIPRRTKDLPLTSFHADIAASVQEILNETMLSLALRAKSLTGSENISLAGGVALNCVSNGKIVNVFGEKNVHLFSASGDAGGAVGAAAIGFVRNNDLSSNSQVFRISLNESKMGRSFTKLECESILNKNNLNFKTGNNREMAKYLASKIAGGACIGIFEGKSEFGPRALGSRSIVASPLISKGQIHINQKIKFRESFRPFAPAVLSEYADRFFEMSEESPYMMRTVQVKGFKRIEEAFTTENSTSENFLNLREISIDSELDSVYSPLPSVTHLDGSARVQTVGISSNSFLRLLLEEFYSITNCPVLVNTSFNVRGEPIVGKPEEALNCLASTGLDYLYLEGLIVDKKELSDDFINNSHSRIGDD